MAKFKERLLQAMELREMKQVDLVQATGLSKPSINQYVKGVYEPKQQALYKIAHALNVNVAWLMGYDVEMESSNSKSTSIDNLVSKNKITPSLTLDEWEHINKYRKLDTHGAEMVDIVLDKEYARSISSKKTNPSDTFVLSAAHERTDIEVTEEMRKHDDDIMMDDSEWE